jgi:hypothetical protein
MKKELYKKPSFEQKNFDDKKIIIKKKHCHRTKSGEIVCE